MIQRVNLQRLRKSDILWMYSHYCQHRHRYLEHPQCFVLENPKTAPTYERVGFLDIETTGLNANWDYVISYAIKTDDGLLGRVLEPEEVLDPNTLDRELIGEFYKNVCELDRLVVWWGRDRRHDIPFLRTRAVKWGAPFPLYREVLVTDAYDIARNKLRLHSNRLEAVANFMHVSCKEHRLEPDIWQQAKLGDRQALQYVWEHNKEDVITLEEVYARLREFIRGLRLSI